MKSEVFLRNLQVEHATIIAAYRVGQQVRCVDPDGLGKGFDTVAFAENMARRKSSESVPFLMLASSSGTSHGYFEKCGNWPGSGPGWWPTGSISY